MKLLPTILPVMLFPAALSATAAPAAGNEYLLIPVGHAQTAIQANAAAITTTDCATRVEFADSNPFANPLPSQRYTGIAYPSVFSIKGAGPTAGYVMQHGLKDSIVLTNLKLAEEGQTCAEIIHGIPAIFKKYTATRQ